MKDPSTDSLSPKAQFYTKSFVDFLSQCKLLEVFVERGTMHRSILFLACSGLMILELTVLLIGWLWLMVRSAPGILHSDYWWSAVILGCAGLASSGLGVWMWYEICRNLLPGGLAWPTESKFRPPALGLSLFVLVASAIVFATLDYIYCWVWGAGYHPAGVALGCVAQTLAVLIPSSYRVQDSEERTVVPILPMGPVAQSSPESGAQSQPEIGFDRHPI